MLYVKEAMFRVSENVLFPTSGLSNRKSIHEIRAFAPQAHHGAD